MKINKTKSNNKPNNENKQKKHTNKHIQSITENRIKRKGSTSNSSLTIHTHVIEILRAISLALEGEANEVINNANESVLDQKSK